MNYQGHDSSALELSPEQVVTGIFDEAGWSVSTDQFADLVVRRGGLLYAVDVKSASEGRADRLIPLVSQAALEIRNHVQHIPDAAALVMVVGRTIPQRVANQVKAFVHKYAPDVAIGLIDSHGLREFSGVGLGTLAQSPSMPAKVSRSVAPKPVHLFSDLGQWLLKVLLAADVADSRLLNAPLTRYRNASELARGGRVSMMTAYRFVAELRSNGFLHESADLIRLVRIGELIDRWRAAVVRPAVTVEARWLFAGDTQSQIKRVSESLGAEICVAFYAAADALGFGIARGVPAHFYVKRLPDDLARALGLVRVPQRSEGQVLFRVPSARESVFRGAVTANGIRSCDVLQTWLDVSHDAIRGHEQAEHITRRVIGPMMKRASQW